MELTEDTLEDVGPGRGGVGVWAKCTDRSPIRRGISLESNYVYLNHSGQSRKILNLRNMVYVWNHAKFMCLDIVMPWFWKENCVSVLVKILSALFNNVLIQSSFPFIFVLQIIFLWGWQLVYRLLKKKNHQQNRTKQTTKLYHAFASYKVSFSGKMLSIFWRKCSMCLIYPRQLLVNYLYLQ